MGRIFLNGDIIPVKHQYNLLQKWIQSLAGHLQSWNTQARRRKFVNVLADKMSNKMIPESCRPQNSVLNALPFTFPHNRCLTQPAAATHTAAYTFPLMCGVRMGSFLIPFYPSLTTVELSDWLGSWQLKHLVLMYKTNINKKSCTDVALTNPRQQEKKQHQQMKGEKNQY